MPFIDRPRWGAPVTVAIALATAGCASANAPETWQGQHHRGPDPVCQIIDSASDWKRLWTHIDQPAPRGWPEGASAAVWLDQQRPSGGYRMTLERVEDGTAFLRLEAPEGPATTVMTQPWLVVLFPDGDATTAECSGPR